MNKLTTLKHPLNFKPFSTVLKENGAKLVNPKRILKVIFIPQDLTPLDEYEAELLKAGYSKSDAKEIVEGLKDSPLYEGKASKS